MCISIELGAAYNDMGRSRRYIACKSCRRARIAAVVFDESFSISSSSSSVRTSHPFKARRIAIGRNHIGHIHRCRRTGRDNAGCLLPGTHSVSNDKTGHVSLVVFSVFAVPVVVPACTGCRSTRIRPEPSIKCSTEIGQRGRRIGKRADTDTCIVGFLLSKHDIVGIAVESKPRNFPDPCRSKLLGAGAVPVMDQHFVTKAVENHADLRIARRNSDAVEQVATL